MPSQPLHPNESDLEVICQRFLLWKFFSSPCCPLFNKGSFLFVFELFQKYSASKVFAMILFSWGIKGDSWLMIWLDLSCKSQSYDDFDTMIQAISVCWSLKAFSQRCDLWIKITADCTHSEIFTKLANMINLKRSLIAQSQKLVTVYTRPQVRIVSRNFTDSYNIKRNTIMNVNRSQKHGFYYIISLERN